MYYVFAVVTLVFAFVFFALMFISDRKRVEIAFLSTIFNLLNAFAFSEVEVVSAATVFRFYEAFFVRLSYILSFISFVFTAIFLLLRVYNDAH